jgi:hypothetical protein
MRLPSSDELDFIDRRQPVEFLLNKVWWLSVAERMAKTFYQAYLAYWILVAGLASGVADNSNASAFDLLFTWNNVKAGIVGVALSFVTSVATTHVGPDDNSPSAVVTETKPTQPDVG